MPKLSCVILSSIFLSICASQAQEANTAAQQSEATAPTTEAAKPKPYEVPAENVLTRCSAPQFLKCMKWSESECAAVITKSVIDGNAEVEKEAASKTEAQLNSDFFKGYAIGVVIGKIHAASKGRLLGCISAQQK